MDIAIIGMAGRFPEAGNIQEFFRHLQEGRDSVRPLSLERMQRTSLSPLPDYEILGYLEDIDLFDHSFFHISLGEAILMDPHQRLLLEVVYQTFENAGYDPAHFAGSDTSIFAGDVNLVYSRHAAEDAPTLTTGNLNAIIAGRIARTFDLRGSAQMIDTSCSSSLVALHHACNVLRLGEAKHAIVCAANMKLFPEVMAGRQDIGISSADGKTRAFSADATGTGTGEAVCCVLLKPYADAVRDGDHIHAIIKGSAVNQDAALSGSLTSPSSAAQAAVIQKAWERAGIDPSTVTYIEAHGTATKLGDPIEVQGMTLAFKEHGCTERSCAIGSVKTNVGHTAAAAGLMGLIKTVLSLKSGQLFPSLHFERPNPFIDFTHSTVYVVNKLSEWAPACGIRRAGVSSFGFSGTNCHVVLEEAPVRKEEREENARHLIVVSGKTRTSLLANVKALSDHLSRQSCDLADVAFTLLTGRKHHAYRFATVVRSMEELLEELAAFVAGGTPAMAFDAVVRDKLIFTFSGDPNIPEAQIDMCRRQAPVFAKHFGDCVRALGKRAPSPAFNKFAFQYSFFKLLGSYGISTNVLIREGIGALSVAAITQGTTLEQCIEELERLSSTASGDQDDRDGRLIEKFKHEAVIFAEMGPAGNILKNAVIPGKIGKVHLSVGNRDVAGSKDVTENKDIVLTYLQQLYLAGWAVDGHQAGKWVGGGGKRIELPVYAFDSVRCWIKEEIHYFETYLRPPIVRNEAAAIKINRGSTCLVAGVQGQVNGYVSAYIRAKEISPVWMDSHDPAELEDMVEKLLRQGVLVDGILAADAGSLKVRQRHSDVRIDIPDRFDGEDIPDRFVMFLIDEALATGMSNVVISPPDVRQQPGAGAVDAAGVGAGARAADVGAGDQVQKGDHTLVQVQSTLEKIWYDVLKKEKLGHDEDFFDIGGHSLNGAQVISRVKTEFQVDLEFEDMLEYSTIRSLAQYIHQRLPSAGTVQPQMYEIMPVAKQPYYAVSPAQRRFWILQQLGKDPSAYNMSASYELKGDLDIEVFRRAILALIDRHESLRTTFDEVDGELVQYVHDMDALGFQLHIDVGLKDEPDYRQVLLERIREEAAIPFDLRKAPLIRAKICQVERDKFVFYFTVHHIAGDGWSLKVMVRDLLALYQGFSKGEPSSLVPLSVQSKDIAAWQNRQSAAEAFEPHRQYWTGQLADGISTLELPADYPQNRETAARGARLRLILTAENSRALREMAKQQQSTLFITLLGAIKLLLYCRTSKEDITIGSPVAGRSHPELEDQVGLYLNTLPIRTRFTSHDTCSLLLDKIKRNTLDAFKYQDHPIDSIITDLNLPLQSQGLFNIGFTYNNYEGPGDPDKAAAWQNVSVENLLPEISSVKADIWFHGFESAEEIGFNIDYNAQLFSKSTMERLMLDLQFVLGSLPQMLSVEIRKVVDLIAENNSAALAGRQENIKRKNAMSLRK